MNGFLLTKISINKTSECIPFQKLSCNTTVDTCVDEDKIKLAFQNDQVVCQQSKAKVVLLLIDAFRYDFAVYNESLQNPLPYENRVPIINNMLISQPEYTRLHQFIADPPTTTMQRLKALTTGSLPTFIDAGSNFATGEIDEDNIIEQVNEYINGFNRWNLVKHFRILKTSLLAIMFDRFIILRICVSL